MRVYFVFEDALDDSGVNLSFVDVPTQKPGEAIQSVKVAAASGDLWKQLYPDVDDSEGLFALMETNMTCLDISSLPQEHNPATVLPV